MIYPFFPSFISHKAKYIYKIRRDIRISAKEVEKLLSRLFFFTQKRQGGRTTP